MNKQIEEITYLLDGNCYNIPDDVCTDKPCSRCKAEQIYNAGYRKQTEAIWVNNHCTACGMTPIGEETWTHFGLTPPKFEYFMSFCPCCGAKMKGD